ncbi:DUF2933 domain-containing protein [Chitinivorax sp. B]|uniref:DUF2933 domain-containing protein n=1 Tax=Chitinivorax sp. B TaxID=2502235 RepID=UPI0010F7A9B4|nr:DUF2933 domain-containing protein [Chitinivorax sp. B]
MQSRHQQRHHNWVLWGFIAVAAFFLLTEHTAHVMGILPYLLLAACPLMHLFMQRHHGGHHDANGKSSPSQEQDEGEGS